MEALRGEAGVGSSMYELGPAATIGGYGSSQRRGRRGNRGKQKREEFDFDACGELIPSAVSAALYMRTAPALQYLADVLDDLLEDVEICSHVVSHLSHMSELVTYLQEIRRRCLLSGEYTHTLLLKATFLPQPIKVRARANTELAAKQAVHVALVTKLCRDVLEQTRT
ncbi:hypothetical protein [Pseudomonas guariconensis]|uniref:hypothetical protein n=1 Tax=Pseudomonas guariconensis TaxID=1288410 RepID=UPI00390661A3